MEKNGDIGKHPLLQAGIVKWFGMPWESGLCAECPQIPVPIGASCTHCTEPITEEDTGIQYANGPYAHKNCFLRATIGSVAHVEKRCGCFVEGSIEGDPEGMTRRQAADAAVAAWERIRMGRIQ